MINDKITGCENIQNDSGNIKFSNADFSYPGVKILENFNLDFEKNRITAVLGTSGCGKTTLLNLISGALTLAAGEILNKPQSVSYVYQEPRLIEQKTVFDNLDFVLRTSVESKATRKTIIEDYLKKTGLIGYKNSYPPVLSGGTAQRVSLVRAFMYPSSVLLLDEPYKGLDITNKESIVKLFFELFNSRPRTVVYVTHDIEEAALTADKVIVLGGRPLKLYKTFDINIPPMNRTLDNPRLNGLMQKIYSAAR